MLSPKVIREDLDGNLKLTICKAETLISRAVLMFFLILAQANKVGKVESPVNFPPHNWLI